MVYCVTKAYLFYGIKLPDWDDEHDDDDDTYCELKIAKFKKDNPMLANRVSFELVMMGDEYYQYYLVIKESIMTSDDGESFIVSTFEMSNIDANARHRGSLSQARYALDIDPIAPRWILVSEGYSSG